MKLYNFNILISTVSTLLTSRSNTSDRLRLVRAWEAGRRQDSTLEVPQMLPSQCSAVISITGLTVSVFFRPFQHSTSACCYDEI